MSTSSTATGGENAGFFAYKNENKKSELNSLAVPCLLIGRGFARNVFGWWLGTRWPCFFVGAYAAKLCY
jgi:hypothetical protein